MKCRCTECRGVEDRRNNFTKKVCQERPVTRLTDRSTRQGLRSLTRQGDGRRDTLEREGTNLRESTESIKVRNR